MLKKYLVSYPSVLFSIAIAFSLMIIYYHYQYLIDEKFNNDTLKHKLIRMVPSFIYSFVVLPLNIVYKLFATYLTCWGNMKFYNFNLSKIDSSFKENHRTNSTHESHLATKLFLVCIKQMSSFYNKNKNIFSSILQIVSCHYFMKHFLIEILIIYPM
jgi:hypothetical protein